MKNILKKKLAGFTLTELLIAMVINFLVFSSLIGVFVANLNTYTQKIGNNRLNQQLESVLETMASDIRRAGYWSNANSNIGTDTNTNPFMSTTSGTDITVGGTGNSCILFTYDRNKNGTLPAITSASDDERYGYRLNGTAVQERPWGANFSCSAAAANWENITDATIQITALTFTLNSQTVTTGPGSTGLLLRSVDITITGNLASNTAITKTLTQHVVIRNDKFLP